MERHHLPTHWHPVGPVPSDDWDDWGVAGICDLVASGDVQQEEKIKTAGRMPAIR